MIYFHASNGFKMADSLASPAGPSQPRSDSLSSSSDSSSLSSDSSNLSSDSSKSSQDSDVEEIEKMDESKVDEIEVKLEPYPKLEGDRDEEHYQGLEYGIVFACHNILYVKFSSLTTAFSEFVV